MADVLKVEPSARIRLTRNGVTLYAQQYAPASQAYSEHVADRLVLATNMTVVQELNLGGVSTGEFLLLDTDRTIKVGIDSQTVLVEVSKAIMISGGSFTHVYLQNESTTNLATVHVVVVD